MHKTGIIVLAAGSSTRLGEPKQLLKYNSKTLLDHILEEAQHAGLDPIICVTGFQSDRITQTISVKGIHSLYNDRWPEGMGSSISAGIEQLMMGDADAVILAVSDQPYVSAQIFRDMLALKHTSGKGIVACSYAGTLGTPVCFSEKYFDNLKLLRGEDGAKKIVQENLADVESIAFQEGRIDIDTKEDYEKLISKII